MIFFGKPVPTFPDHALGDALQACDRCADIRKATFEASRKHRIGAVVRILDGRMLQFLADHGLERFGGLGKVLQHRHRGTAQLVKTRFTCPDFGQSDHEMLPTWYSSPGTGRCSTLICIILAKSRGSTSAWRRPRAA